MLIDLQPEADLEFAVRMFKLQLTKTGTSRSEDTLFLPFAVLDRFCQQRPDDATALHLFALVCERLGQADLAATLVERAVAVLDAEYNQSEDVQVERRFAIAHVNLGRLRLALSQFSEASEALEVALNLLPTGEEDESTIVLRAHALYCQAVAAYKTDDLTKALSLLEGAMEEVPSHLSDVRSHITLVLAQALWAVGSEEAREMGKQQLFTACVSITTPRTL